MADLFLPNLQDFLGLARRRGFARRNRYLVEFFPPILRSGTSGAFSALRNAANDISLLCEEANFPGKSITTRSLRINALSEQRAHLVDYKNKEINFKFITDTTWQAKSFFDTWMAQAVNPMENATSNPREVGFYKDYAGKINIYSLTPIFEEDNTQNVETPIYGVTLHEAWPVSLEAQNMATGAENYHRLSVGITFKWWESIPFTIDTPPPTIRSLLTNV